MMELVSQEKPLEHFSKAVDLSMARHNLNTSEEVCAYLAFMLRDYISVDGFRSYAHVRGAAQA